MGSSKWMAWSSFVIGIYTAVCAALVFLTRTFVVAPLVLVGIILGAWHLFRSSQRRKTAWVGIILCAGGLALFDYGWRLRTARIQAATSAWTGYTSPHLQLTALDGSTIDSTTFANKRVLLNFWATWCPPCRTEVKDLRAFVSATSRNDVIVIGISEEERAVLEPFIDEHGINYPVISIPREKLPPPYNTGKMIPASFILDRNGTIQFVQHGAMSVADLTSLVRDAEDFRGVPKRIESAASNGDD